MTVDDDGIGGSGYSMEDLSDYLDRGREPFVEEIETNPECQAVLSSLERMGQLSREMVDEESESTLDEGWFDGIMREVAREVRAGRDIPLVQLDDRTTLVVTEGAVRGMLRELGDALPGVIVERTRIAGDITEPGGRVNLDVAISVAFGRPLQQAADDVRRIATAALTRHTALSVDEVNVTVDSIHGHDPKGAR
ncbi:Asp23/Gls24 family envelope stress response protein [Microbacterium sp. SLBN-146]|uniref:Asp23/Gls24 family envelope stress response protein n=1 Tax=Microbacterium sp. SLBN-146 TaxID=2768457 RepID=UPI0011518FAB|nr:Asp23/Gls24 family envelope stress response protein [Microbacterium sp. SLBN-146]TQJ31535.1 cell envelope-related Asp23 family protein [Microbacterium sp. SLBN-146]